MIVCIAEKPSVAKDIALVLGAKNRHITKGIGYMEGNGYCVTWTFGHLCTLKEPHDYYPQWRQWQLEALPMIPHRFGIKPIDLEHYQRQLELIQRLLTSATMVINCGDAGQEGELIQRWVLQHCGCRVPVKRLWISSLTNEAIQEGFAHLRDESELQSLYEAGLARAIGDWLLGMNATRLYTLRYAKARGQVLSIGRVQTPTLALMTQREQEIAHFTPETYWELKTRYRATTFSADKGRFDDKTKAEALLAQIRDEELEIVSVKKKGGKELPPRLFDLTSLQVLCNKRFGMSAEETLSTIQSLYEKKLTTYPRVDTTYLSEDIYPKVGKILLELVSYRALTSPILNSGKIRKSKKHFDNSKVTDHHAIIPTGQPVHGLSDREAKVFDLVARHFIAIFYPDCEISTTSVEARVGQLPFKVKGREVLSPGWRVVFEEERGGQSSSGTESEGEEAESEGERMLPTFVVGERGPHSPEIKERQTQPPKPYTEATLLRAMETAGKLVENEELREAMKDNGIGRPSTRANIIETLLKRGYIVKERKNVLRPTQMGMRLISTINSELLKSAELTGQWEYKLRQIERRELPASAFIDELKAMVIELVSEVLSPPAAPRSREPLSPPPAEPQGPLCPLCGRGRIIRGREAYGCSAWREGCAYRLNLEEYARSYASNPQGQGEE